MIVTGVAKSISLVLPWPLAWHSLANAPELLRQYGVEPKPGHLRTLEGMLSSLRSGALDFVLEDEDLYDESDIVERYSKWQRQ